VFPINNVIDIQFSPIKVRLLKESFATPGLGGLPLHSTYSEETWQLRNSILLAPLFRMCFYQKKNDLIAILTKESKTTEREFRNCQVPTIVRYVCCMLQIT